MHNEKNSTSPTKIATVCLLAVGAALAAVVIFGMSWGTVATAGILLACPLMHVFMMSGGKHKH